MAEHDSDFGEFVASRSASLLRAAYLLTGEHGRAEDLLQVVLTNVYLRWSSITDPDSYVRRSLVHEHTSWWRRLRNREVPSRDVAPETHSPDATSQVDLRDAMLRALATLSPRQRAVVVLRFYCDLGEAEVARALGCSVGTVKSYNAEAMARLRAHDGLADACQVRRKESDDRRQPDPSSAQCHG